MEQPSLFDKELGVAMENATAEQALAMLANDPRIVSELTDALERHDVDSKKPGSDRPGARWYAMRSHSRLPNCRKGRLLCRRLDQFAASDALFAFGISAKFCLAYVNENLSKLHQGVDWAGFCHSLNHVAHDRFIPFARRRFADALFKLPQIRVHLADLPTATTPHTLISAAGQLVNGKRPWADGRRCQEAVFAAICQMSRLPGVELACQTL